jgi:hypothetical protein
VGAGRKLQFLADMHYLRCIILEATPFGLWVALLTQIFVQGNL